MIVTVAIHMAQVFIYGAYRRPREATWLVGTVLLLLVLAFGLTGYLLPWDNRAYWETVVTTQIMASVPFAGPALTRLAGVSNGVGVVTFSRLDGLHTAAAASHHADLIASHVYLVRRTAWRQPRHESGSKQKFYPNQAFRDATAIFVAFVVLFVVAVAVRGTSRTHGRPHRHRVRASPGMVFPVPVSALEIFSWQARSNRHGYPSISCRACSCTPPLRQSHTSACADGPYSSGRSSVACILGLARADERRRPDNTAFASVPPGAA